MNDNFKINVGNPIDSRYLASTNQPYVSVVAVNSAIAESQRYVGLTVNINNVEYWYETGVLDGSLVIKDSGLASTGVTAAYNGITKENNAVKLGGTLTGATEIDVNGNSLSFTTNPIQYTGDYSTQLTAQSIPDAEFVTGLTSQSITSSSNGLTKDGQDIKLGGTTALDETTNICGGAQALNLGTAASKLGAFTVNATSGVMISDGILDFCANGGALKLDSSSCVDVNSIANYDQDYSGSYSTRSLVDKAYLDGEISGATNTFENGLTETSGTVELGGTLTKSTTINVGTEDLKIRQYTVSEDTYETFLFIDTSIGAQLRANNVSAGNNSIVSVNSSEATISSFDGTHTTRMKATGNAIQFASDTPNWEGVKYLTDYSSNYTARSLVDKAYIDDEINNLTGTTSQAVTGATNGLTKDGQNVCLGGILSEATDVDIDGNNLTMTNTIGTVFQITDTFLNLWDNNNSGIGVNENGSYMTSPSGHLILGCGGDNENVFFDYGSGVGLTYSDDYSINYVDRSLVDKEYVDSCISDESTTASNGLTKTGTNVVLGGDLDTDTLINLNNGNCLEICDTGLDTSYKFDVTGVDLNSKGSSFEIGNTGDNYILTHCSGSNVDLSLSGLTYGGNYESNFCENTLVTKAYVDNATGGISANNGLSRSGDNIVLGGDLTGDTTISSTSHDDCLLITAPMCATDVHMIGFDATPSVSWVEGQLYYDNCQLNFDREVSGVTLQIGEEQVIRVTNVTGSLIPNGTVVYVNGASSGLPTVDLADSTDFVKATQTVGITNHDIADTNEGYISTIGTIHDVDTNGFAVGSLLWLNTGGTYSDTRPSYPDFSVSVGMVTKAGAGDGEIYVRLLYVPNYTEYGLFTGYTASTLTTLNEKLNINDFNIYSGTTDDRITANEEVTAVALTGATNGLCGFDGRNATLGGALTKPTTISGAQIFTIGTANDICLVTTTTKEIGLNAKENGELYLKSQQDSVDGSDMTNAVGIALDYNENAAMLVTDNKPIPRGLQYAADYTASYCDRSLVDKFYVDSIATGLNVHASVAAATTVADGNQDLSGGTGTIDTVNIADLITLGGQWNRILVKDQTDATFNGIYSATTGDWGRTSDYDFAPSGEISNGDLIPVLSGLTNHNSQWINVSVNPIISGDSLNFSIFSQQQGVIGGDGIAVSTVGTNREVTVDLAASNAGLCISANALQLDYNVFTCGLDTSTSGEVRVNASLDTIIGNEIPVIIGSGNALFVDSDDFSVTLARNGLHKTDAYIALGGTLTGATTITGGGGSSLSFDTLSDFGVGFNNTAIITDNSGSPHGICYAADYRSGFVDLSLVDKYFVNNAITGDTLTFTNGLTKVDNTICWGSTTPMTADAGLLRDTTRLCVKEIGVDIKSDCSCIYAMKTAIDLRSCNSSGCDSSIELTDTGTMALVANNTTQGLTITSAAHGAVYAGAYKGDFVCHSLVDVDYVTGLTTTSGIQTASNGLTKTGTDVCLGGTLSSNVSIISDGTKCLTLGNVTNTICQIIGNANNYQLVYGDELSGSRYGYFDMSEGLFRTTLTYDGTTMSIDMDSTDAFILRNDATTGGVKYYDDYSDDYSARSLVDAAYVTGLTSVIETEVAQAITGATNGLTKSGQDVKLGGTLTENTTITGNYSYDLNLGTQVSPLVNLVSYLDSDLCIYAGAVGRGELELNTCCSEISHYLNANEHSTICMSHSDGMKISFGSTGTTSGLTYADDYSSLYSLRSIPDVAWVTGQTSSSGVQTASNGLTKTGTNVKLGGTLTELTTISGNTQTFNFGDTNSPVGLFYVNTSLGTKITNDVSGEKSFLLNNSSVKLHAETTTSSASSNLSQADGLLLTFSGTSNAAYYDDDYSSIFNARSLVDKAYVDGEITGATNTFENGLTETSGTVKLGGALTENTIVGGGYGIAFGNNVKASGANSFAIGCGGYGILEAVGDNSFAGGWGYFGVPNARGNTSFVFGGDYSWVCGDRSAVLGGFCNRTLTTGSNESGIFVGEGNSVYSRNSAIIAGSGNTLCTADCKSVILGGNGINANGSLPNHAIVPNLAIWDTPADDADGAILVWDSSTKKVGKTTITIPTADVTGATNGLSVVDREVELGGTLTKDTTISGGTYDLTINSTEFNIDASSSVNIFGDLITITGTSDIYIENTTESNFTLISGDITLNSNSTVDITGIVTLQSTPNTGSATSDAVLVWNSTDKQIKQVDASNLGEDNNIYSKTTYTASQLLTTSSTYVILVNHSIPVTITLPAAPTDGQAFKIKDASSAGALTNNITIARNGNNIDRSASDALINTDGGALEMVYDSSLGWFGLAFVN